MSSESASALVIFRHGSHGALAPKFGELVGASKAGAGNMRRRSRRGKIDARAVRRVELPIIARARLDEDVGEVALGPAWTRAPPERY